MADNPVDGNSNSGGGAQQQSPEDIARAVADATSVLSRATIGGRGGRGGAGRGGGGRGGGGRGRNRRGGGGGDDDDDRRPRRGGRRGGGGGGRGGRRAEEDDDDDEDEDYEDDEEDDDDDDEPNMMDMLPRRVVTRVEKLKELNSQRDKIMEEYLKERAALEVKYNKLCQPLYGERLEVVTGKRDEELNNVYEEEKKKKKENEEEDEEEKNDEATPEDEQVKGIPQFWVCAIGHLDAVAELVTERDVDCLEHLVNVTCDDDEDGRGFTLQFHFEPNDYFHNDVLVKRYEIPNLLLEDEPILKNVTGCDIQWKSAAQNLCFREVTKKQRSKSGKRAGQIRTVTKKERADSFFHFFSPPKIPSMEDMDEEEADAIEEAFDHDYDVAQAFRSHLIPRAVLWFTGEALDDDDEMDEAELEEAWPGDKKESDKEGDDDEGDN